MLPLKTNLLLVLLAVGYPVVMAIKDYYTRKNGGALSKKRQFNPVVLYAVIVCATLFVLMRNKDAPIRIKYPGQIKFIKYLKNSNMPDLFPLKLVEYIEKTKSIAFTERVIALSVRLKADPKNTEALVDLGNLYYDSDLSSIAIKAYEKSLKFNPHDVNVITDLGVMYRRTGNAKKAVECFDKAIAVRPEFQPAYFNKGIVLLDDLNDKPGAIESWEKILEINSVAVVPNGQPLKEFIDQIKNEE
ncbi:MAG: hypothetical protein WC695_09330 [Candidatus Omnitrophota bacterium]